MQYCADNESMKKDAGNQRTDIEWINIGGESECSWRYNYIFYKRKAYTTYLGKKV